MQFSVSMCVYGKDNPEHFKTAMDSVINQTSPPDEIVLVVDGPIPQELQTAIDGFGEKHDNLNVIYLEKNSGHGESRRIGISNCRYPLIAIMDADDISLPDRFEKQLAKFKENPNLSIVGGNIREFIGSPENVVGVRQVPMSDEDIKNYMKSRCPFNQVTVMFKKDSVELAGGYLDWYCNEDYYLWIRMALCGFEFANLNDILVDVRVSKEMYGRRGGWKYFRSEAKLQMFMYKKRIISVFRLIYNVLVRFAVQVIMPNGLRAFIYKRFARESAEIQ